MHQVDVNWRPRFLPLVELLLLFPPSLLLSFFLRTNATFLPSVICSADSRSGPWRTPPSNLSTPGGGLFTQCWLGVPWTALVTSFPSFLTPMLIHSSPSFFSTIPPPQSHATPLSVVHVPSRPTPLELSGAPQLGQDLDLPCRSPGSKDVNQGWFLQAFLRNPRPGQVSPCVLACYSQQSSDFYSSQWDPVSF